MYRDTTNVEPEMYDYASNNWSHWNSNEKLKEKFGSCTSKTFDRLLLLLLCIYARAISHRLLVTKPRLRSLSIFYLATYLLVKLNHK